jgi:hypothetical protein
MLAGQRITEEGWTWWFEGGSRPSACGFVLEADDKIVGHLGCVSGEAWVERHRLRLGTAGFGWVKRGYQGVGGFKRLGSAFLDSASREFDLLIAFTSPRIAGHYRQLGLGTPVGAIASWGTSEDAFALRNVPVRHALRSAARCAAWLASRGPSFVRVEPLRSLDDEVDALAETSASFAPCIRVRDSAYLQWRWHEMPGNEQWESWAARDRRGRLRGWVVFGEDPRSGRGLITDILATDAGATRRLVRLAVRRLRERGCTGVQLQIHDRRRWVKRALLRSGLLPRGHESVVVTNAFSTRVEQLTGNIDNWYLTLGDVDALVP